MNDTSFPLIYRVEAKLHTRVAKRKKKARRKLRLASVAAPRKTCTWPSFRDKHRRSYHYRCWTWTARPGWTPITPSAINEGERSVQSAQLTFIAARTRIPRPIAPWIIIGFYCRLTRSIKKRLGRQHVREKERWLSATLYRSLYVSRMEKGDRNSVGNCTP